MEYRWSPGEILDILVEHPRDPCVTGRIVCKNDTRGDLTLLDGFAQSLVSEALIDLGGEGEKQYEFEQILSVTIQITT